MGGRGQSDTTWKRKLRSWAKQGRMPGWISGSREQQAEAFAYIDKIYEMPQTSGLNVRVTDQGDGVHVRYGDSVSRSGYPSKQNASDAEKRGVLKWLLYNMQKQSPK